MGFDFHMDIFNVHEEIYSICRMITGARVVFEVVFDFDCVCHFQFDIADENPIVIQFFFVLCLLALCLFLILPFFGVAFGFNMVQSFLCFRDAIVTSFSIIFPFFPFVCFENHWVFRCSLLVPCSLSSLAAWYIEF